MHRQALLRDIPSIRDLERRAGEPFRALGLDAVADDEPPTVEDLRGPVEDGEIRVIDEGRPDGRLSAWLWLMPLDDGLHIEQVSVDPEHRGRRLGTQLVRWALDRAGELGLPEVTLTTFADVPWNGPLYRRLGFRVLGEQEMKLGLRTIREVERALGLDVVPRVAMIAPSRT